MWITTRCGAPTAGLLLAVLLLLTGCEEATKTPSKESAPTTDDPLGGSVILGLSIALQYPAPRQG